MKLFTELLMSEGLITLSQLKTALSKREFSQQKLEDLLVELKFVKKNVLKQILKKSHSQILHDDFDKTLCQMFLSSFLRKYDIFPLRKEGDILFLATTDTQRFDLIDDLRFVLKTEFELVLYDRDAILDAIDVSFPEESSKNTEQDNDNNNMNKELPFLERDNISKSLSDKDSPINAFVEEMFKDAFSRRVSDIHIEPLKNQLRLRYRVDGLLYEMENLPFKFKNAITSRIKLMSGMDISEKRLPQDGKIFFHCDGTNLSLRVSSMPSLYGESLSLRILDKNKGSLQFNQLGLLEKDRLHFEKMTQFSNGLILITGPTGSGKTTTLYALLNALHSTSQKIITIEDPVEYQLSGISQVHINTKVGLTFAKVLRAVLRQAPNVIMIGEIRDMETANIVVQASLTGHLVISTLHTDSVSSAVVRLFDMGVFPYKVASSLRVVVSQRLVRQLCKNCKKERVLSKEEKLFFTTPPKKVFEAVGCDECLDTGYWGRLGVFQIMFVNDVIRESIYQTNAEHLIKQHLKKQSIFSLWEDALEKVKLGLTSIKEIRRVVERDQS